MLPLWINIRYFSGKDNFFGSEEILYDFEDLGLLVQVDCAIADSTSPAYQRGSLPRLSMKSHLGDGFALRCFQRLS